jgi:hypothetical protein
MAARCISGAGAGGCGLDEAQHRFFVAESKDKREHLFVEEEQAIHRRPAASYHVADAWATLYLRL